mgnify:CR=1 FL=1
MKLSQSLFLLSTLLLFSACKKEVVDDLDGIITVGDFYARADTDNTHMLFV